MWKKYKKSPLHIKIIAGLVAGIIFAVVSSALGISQFTVDWIDPFGTIFIRALKMIAVPLVLFSIIKGITGLHDVSKLGRLGLKTILIYLVTTVTAVSIGLALVNTVQPGKLVDENQRIENRRAYENWVAQKDGVELIDGEQKVASESGEAVESKPASGPDLSDKMEQAKKQKEAGPLQFLVDMVPGNLFLSLSNNGLMLQVICFALFFGVCLLSIEKKYAKPVIDFVDGMNEVFLKMVDVIMKAAPFFVFALLAGVVSKMAGDDPGKVIEIFKGLGWYSLTVVVGLAAMVFGIYPLVLTSLKKKMSYKKFFKALGPAQMLAFSTSSSAATLPVTMECVNENLKVPKSISSFVLPIGATVNMDGTSLYQAVAVIFLAQFHMVDLTLGQQLMIILTATLASIGSAAVPSAGLIMLIIVLESVGLNPAWIAIIFPVDRILDMCRTVVNVTGDATVSTIIAQSEGELAKD
ncbi:dicarboxylate/amino acid:cation symporter [Luteibaculum oceani]|uniref:Dicarboxylate/amino acid:cation symporter n=1 Tax=Luteibaculum oceani TaxID=1294296 RepID=A0A5C6VA42_9FLAO|nr:dicarboxylate/amino acid:cation symporter [Luteibaculum oceani]TXC81351.1 dicarboxylate/amino acid:cation symporter [Luteibaculum oceani]